MTLDMTLVMVLLILLGWGLYAGVMHVLDLLAVPPRIRRVK